MNAIGTLGDPMSLRRGRLAPTVALLASVGMASPANGGSIVVKTELWKFNVVNPYLTLPDDSEDAADDRGADTFNLILMSPSTRNLELPYKGDPLAGAANLNPLRRNLLRFQTPNVTVKLKGVEKVEIAFDKPVETVKVSASWSITNVSKFVFQNPVVVGGKIVPMDLNPNQEVGSDGGVAPIAGFKILGDPIFTLFNDVTVPIEIRDLGFMVNVPMIPESLLDPDSAGGFDDIVVSGPIPLSPGGSFDLQIPQIDDGKYLYARWDVYEPGTDNLLASELVAMSAAQVPEPRSLVLWSIGALALWGRSRTRFWAMRKTRPTGRT